MTIFDDVAAALANLLGTTSELAGFLLGFAVVVTCVVALYLALGDAMRGTGLLIPSGIGFVLAVLVGWFPLWTVIFMALVIAIVVIKPFGSGVEM